MTTRARQTSPPTLLDLSRSELAAIVEEMGEPKYRARQIWKAMYGELVAGFEDISTLPQSLRNTLRERFVLDPVTPALALRSKDREVDKVLFRLSDGELIETVLMRYHAGSDSRARSTVCVSTQAGCALGCTFCATGQQGFRRQLSAGEIAAQVRYMNRLLRDAARDGSTRADAVTNVVFMGMGEPLANYDNTLKAIAILNDEQGTNLGARHMTVSTVGLAPQIAKLATEPYQINLAVSLHAPNDAMRSRTMPVNRRYPISTLMKAVRLYIAKTNRRVSFEYVLLAGENDRPEHAAELATLLSGMLCHVNLIPVNPTKAPYHRPNDGRIGKFKDILRQAGIAATVRVEKGIDIDAGCGQLRARALAAVRP